MDGVGLVEKAVQASEHDRSRRLAVGPRAQVFDDAIALAVGQRVRDQHGIGKGGVDLADGRGHAVSRPRAHPLLGHERRQPHGFPGVASTIKTSS